MRTTVRLLLLLCIVAGALAWWVWHDYQRYLQRPALTAQAPVRMVIEPGWSFAAVLERLMADGGLTRPGYLAFHARRTGKSSLVKAGEYDLQPHWKPAELLAWLTSGQVVQYSMAIVEGLTFKQLRKSLASHPVLLQTLGGLDDQEIMVRLGFAGVHPEGRFFPDTYHFPRGTTDVQFLQRAYRAMARRLATEWQHREPGLPLASAEEALVLASIIEKETGLASERAEIAGVFVRRLRKGMRLETDPTVIYGMGAAFDGNLRRADLRRDTPYNTYTRTGLPPTPIATPSGDAIHAAMHPAAGRTLFFVARGDGSHQFSATYPEHRRAVRRYQLKGRSPNRKRAQQAVRQ